MVKIKNTKIRVGTEGPIGFRVPVYRDLRDLKIQGKLTERDLEDYAGQIVVFERNDIALEGRLYLTDGKGSHNTQRESIRDRFVIKPVNARYLKYEWDPPSPWLCRWDKVESLGIRNPIHSNWDIYLKTGDKVITKFAGDILRRYDAVLEESD